MASIVIVFSELYPRCMSLSSAKFFAVAFTTYISSLYQFCCNSTAVSVLRLNISSLYQFCVYDIINISLYQFGTFCVYDIINISRGRGYSGSRGVEV